ncbi:MAG: hypothetical protein ACK4M7_09020, partial [Burkholderiales bacterium]
LKITTGKPNIGALRWCTFIPGSILQVVHYNAGRNTYKDPEKIVVDSQALKKLNKEFLDEDIIEALYYFCKFNDLASVRKIVRAILTNDALTPKQKVEKLTARVDNKGVCALFVAMQDGHAEVVEELVTQILNSGLHIDYLIKLLNPTDSSETPALNIAMTYGKDRVIRKYAELIIHTDKLNDQQKVELLTAADARELPVSALARGMLNAHTDAVISLLYYLLHLRFDMATLNQWVSILHLNTMLIAIDKDKKFLPELLKILKPKQQNELFNIIIKSQRGINKEIFEKCSMTIKEKFKYKDTDEFLNGRELALKALENVLSSNQSYQVDNA